METPAIVWKKHKESFLSGIYAMVSPIRIGSVYYDSLRPSNDIKKYFVKIDLPPLQVLTTHYEKESDAKKELERLWSIWFRE